MLERMKGLLLLPALEMATLKQVATFYDVSEDVIKFLVHNHKDEIISDGFVTYRKDEVIDSLKVDVLSLQTGRGKTIVTVLGGGEITIPSRGLRLFPKRAILRVGMLLRDSEVAKEVRTQLFPKATQPKMVKN